MSNNYAFAADPLTPVCGGRQLIRLTPTGEDAPGAPYTGGGLYGAGFGITIDPQHPESGPTSPSPPAKAPSR